MANVNRRNTFKASIFMFAKTIDAFTGDTALHELNDYLENVNVAWSSFQTVHFDILDVTGRESFDYQAIEYSAVEDVVIASRSKIHSFMAHFQMNDSSTENNSIHGSHRNDTSTYTLKKKSLRLEPMKLPEFDGSYSMWPSFRDLFHSLIHENTELTNVQKLYYLKKALKGGAASDLISDVELTEINYVAALDIVEKRFENNYLLVLALLDKIFKLPEMTAGDPHSARKLLDATTQTILSLTNLQRDTQYWDDILIYVTITKLDDASKRKWNELTANVTDVPKWTEMQDFLRTRFRSYDTSAIPSSASSSSYFETDKVFASSKSFHLSESNEPSNSPQSISKPHRKCPACSSEKKDHRLRLCTKFKGQSPQQRKTCIEKNRLCYNRFSNNHSVSSCNSTYSCQKCQGKHHTMLHIDNASTETKEKLVKTGLVVGITNAQRIQSNLLFKHVLLATALVDVKNQNGVWYRFRALLDQGSQASFVTERAAQLLHLQRRNTDTMFESVGNHQIHRPNGIVDIEFMSSCRSPTILPTFPVNAFILPSITNLLPSHKIEMQNWSHLANLQLADPMFNEPNAIDLLLGGDIYSDILLPGLIKSKQNGLIDQKSALGWFVMGHIQLPFEPASVQSISFCKIDCQHLQQFWELEEISAPKPLSEEENYCEKH